MERWKGGKSRGGEEGRRGGAERRRGEESGG